MQYSASNISFLSVSTQSGYICIKKLGLQNERGIFYEVKYLIYCTMSRGIGMNSPSPFPLLSGGISVGQQEGLSSLPILMQESFWW